MNYNFRRTCSVIALILCVVGRGVPAEPLPAATNSLGMEMAAVPPGTFVMGEDYDGDWDERPAHRVKISRPFQISASEVTLEQFRQFRPQHNCALNGKATGLSWHDAVAFCEWLSRKEGKPWRLPTEAEWEYAARAGTTNRFWSGHAPPANADDTNAWGLKGTHDPVVEWCYDWHGPYSVDDQTDPLGPVSGIARVVRGDKPDMDDRLKDEKGRQAVDYHRSANRAGLPPRFATQDPLPDCHRVAFRVVQGEMPRTEPTPVFAPFIRQGVKAPIAHLKQAPDKPYFRKRHLLPIPPDNAPDEAIAAAGLPRAFRKHNHSPALEVCPNGDLLLILYTSYFEYEPGVSFMGARLRFGSDQWDMPEPIFDTPDANDHAPLLWTDWNGGFPAAASDARIWFFWGWPKLRAGAYPFQWMTSDDSGATWSEVQFPRFSEPAGPHSRQPINTALRSAEGTIYVASDGDKASSVLWTTKDAGQTWHDTGGRTAGRHTTFALMHDGSILGLGGKSSDIDGYMPQVISHDGGKSWQTNKSSFPAQGVNQRPSLLRLQSGRLLFAADFQRRGNLAPKEIAERGSYVALSDDDGRTWRIKKLPGAQPHERPELQKEPPTLGYTAARQAPNGMIHLVTTMNTPCLHFEFNEAWILSDTELLKSTAARVPKVETFTEKFADGQIRFRWTGGIADDGRFLKHGPEKWYYPNGKLHYAATFHLGRKTGTETLYRPEGRLSSRPVWRWQHASDGTSTWTQFRNGGFPAAESTWRGSVAHGKARTWDRAGRILSEVNFVDGRLN
ncbi:MAG: SUMF1/EgtB/PvdO family nonheme iron enzyme [Gemmataceae bacterium]|nr:SUMF1/EgtB/PvdO family nonheme iron enzyme [Gemmataceae bacterium]